MIIQLSAEYNRVGSIDKFVLKIISSGEKRHIYVFVYVFRNGLVIDWNNFSIPPILINFIIYLTLKNALILICNAKILS